MATVAWLLALAPAAGASELRDYAKHTYAEALFYLKHTDRLTADQREWLLGRTAATVLGWG